MLAGDHKQLAPTVKSRKAEAGLPTPSSTATADTASPPPHSSNAGGGAAAVATDGLGLTMFDRVLRDLGEGVCRMLDVQYRMNRDICDWASTEVGLIFFSFCRPRWVSIFGVSVALAFVAGSASRGWVSSMQGSFPGKNDRSSIGGGRKWR